MSPLLKLAYVVLLSTTGVTRFRTATAQSAPPSISDPPKSQTVFTTHSDGTQWSVQLTCKTLHDTTPSSNRQWKRSFGDIVPSQAIQADGSLLLTSIQAGIQATKDGNRYQCIAENPIGKVLSSSAVLTYANFDTANWIEPSGTITGYVDNQVLIPCTVPADAVPVPVVIWFENGVQLVTSSSPYALSPSGNLYINPVQVNLNESTYYCQITNYHITYQLSSTTATLIVRPKAEAPDFEITVQPTDLTITKGQEGFFEASAITNKAITQYSWGFPGDGPSPSFSMRGRSTTTISNAVEGLYTCQIIHDGVATATRQPTLTINVPPTISTEISSVTVGYIGHPFSLECTASGKPDVNVVWYQNAAKLTEATGTVTYTVDSAVAADHAGMYQCFANNKVGEDHKTTRVIIRPTTMPNVTINPKDTVKADPGQSTHTCVSYGDPAPEIMWSIDKVKKTDGIAVTVSGLRTTSVLTYAFDDPFLAGVHTISCLAKNLRGNVTADSTINIQVEIFINEMPSSQTIYYQKAGVVSCPHVASPALNSAAWTLNKAAIDLSSAKYSLSSGDLNIADVQLSDRGEYCCTLTNAYDANTNTATGCSNVTVDAHAAFVGNNSKKRFQEETSNVLVCSAIGEPLPTIEWRKGVDTPPIKENVEETRDGFRVDSTLTFANVMNADGGDYYCFIENSLNKLDVLFSVEVYNVTKEIPESQVPVTELIWFPYIAVFVPAGILIFLVLILACVHCRKRGSYVVTKDEPNIKPFHVRAGGNDEGELYAEAGPDIIQQRRKFLQEQAVPPEEPNGQYATIGSKRSSTLAQSPNRPAPPYPGKAAPPYHEKDVVDGGNTGSFV
ncbi:contactin-2-like isoform X2 [Oscarella lobularis]|uniref:contactin-2-like isoform X2 n=1 Tax=Oscarella lobularis TaxID=121494 RepID=UPI003313A990